MIIIVIMDISLSFGALVSFIVFDVICCIGAIFVFDVICCIRVILNKLHSCHSE